MTRKTSSLLCTLSMFTCFCFPAKATPERDAQWKKLLAQATKHGGTETVSGHTASYVFTGPNGMDVTLTHSLDNKVRLVCAGQMQANINICWNWDTQTCLYSTRADASAPWSVSKVVPDFNRLPPETQSWGIALLRICGIKAKAPHALTPAIVQKVPEVDPGERFIRALVGDYGPWGFLLGVYHTNYIYN